MAGGAFVTGAIMVAFSSGVIATSDNWLTDSVVHTSNLKFMAAMWCVIGVMFAVGAQHLHDVGTWRLLRLACLGISVAAIVRIVEMVRLDQFSPYGAVAAVIELVIPMCTIYLRRRWYVRLGE